MLAKVAATVVAASLVVGVAFVAAPRAEAAALTAAQVQSIISLLQSFGADAATIANVQASLTGGSPSVPSAPSSCSFTRDLTLGATGADVTSLQQALIAAGYSIPAGATGYFGAQTQAAVAKWQAAAGVSPAAGYFGPKSRAAFPCAGGPSSGPAPAGTGLTVSAGAAIPNQLAPQGTSRVPFTNFNVTAGNDGDVVINSVTVQRVGSAQDAGFAGVVLVDLDTGEQVGTAKTFNSNHQTNVGEKVTIPRGTTKRFQIAGNMAASLASYAGEAPGLSVVAINTSATVTGALPIMGAFHTTNATLTTGSLSLDTSNSFAANTTVTKELGSTVVRVSGFRLTAGSSEDVRLKSIRWNQTGSVAGGDIANVMTNIGGTAYPATLSADGKYYSTNLGSGLVIPKGNQVDVYAQYDIIGSNSSGRTVIFDVDKTTDIFGTGEVYGYGISPGTTGASAVPTSRGNTTETTGTPYVYANQITVQGATVTTIGKANEVPAQNIAINVPNQPLGGYIVDVKGENMTVASTLVTFSTSTASLGADPLTNLTLVDENGAVIAGPKDATCTSTCTATFTDTITYKTGRHVYTVRGKVPSTASNNAVITASTIPSGWGTVRGETTGNTISLASNGTFNMNAMTVKAGSLVVGRGTSPASQTLTPGGTSVHMVNFQLDATQSGEDVRVSSIPVQLRVDVGSFEGAPNKLSACQLFDGATALNTGSNVLSPTATATTSATTATVTLDNPVTAVKGTVKTLGMRCDIASSADDASQFAWDVQDADGAPATVWAPTGATSGTTIAETDATDGNVIVTIGSGSVTVTTDASNPSYKNAAANSTGVTNTVIKYRSNNEDVILQKIGLTLTNAASSSSSDLIKVTLWDGATKVGEAFFTGSATVATSTLTSPVTLTKNVDKAITVKADYAGVGTDQPVTFSGHLVAVDELNGEGVGAQSGTTIYPSGSTASNGTRLFKSVPVIALDTLSTTGIADGRLMRFKVTADVAGPVGITQFGLNLATSSFAAGGGLTNVTIYGFEDSSYSTPISGVSADGNLQATNDCASGCSAAQQAAIVVGVTTSGGTATVVQVPAGVTRYFEVRASAAGVQTGTSATSKLLGNSSFATFVPAAATTNPMATATNSVLTDLVWSPNSTTTAVRADLDWANGFGVSGLPAGGLLNTRSQ